MSMLQGNIRHRTKILCLYQCQKSGRKWRCFLGEFLYHFFDKNINNICSQNTFKCQLAMCTIKKGLCGRTVAESHVLKLRVPGVVFVLPTPPTLPPLSLNFVTGKLMVGQITIQQLVHSRPATEQIKKQLITTDSGQITQNLINYTKCQLGS